jgi:membrane protease YdiL (CAAX protease family)
MDWHNWQLTPGRLAAAGCVLAYAFALFTVGSAAASWLGVLLVAQVALLCLPWRLPREQRGRLSFWAESFAGLSAPIGAVVVAALSRPDWLTRGVAWWWLAAGVITGAGLVLFSGVNLRALASGQLAFLLGSTRHGRARATAGAVGPFGEEALFRGTVLAASATAATPIGLLASVAFVATHFIQPGDNGRGSTRAMAVAIVAGAALLLLAIGSGSIYPGLIAHLLNNVPGVVLELQRADWRNADDG